MDPYRVLRLFSLFSALTPLLCAAGARGELNLGVASVPINAPPGIGLAGYYHARGNEGVLDDLHAKGMVLDDGTTRAAIVVCDLISMPRWITDEARAAIEKETGIPGTNVLIAATHTHTAPVLYRDWLRDEADGATSEISMGYSRGLPGRIARAVADASHRRQPVRLFAAREHEPKLAHNRRWWMSDGSVGWNPGKRHPDLVRPAGPIDPEVGVLYAETATERPEPILTFVNYAMHPDTTGGTRLSADYPGALARILALYKGEDMLTLFANGTCGNLNHVNFGWAGAQKGPQEANRLGVILAAAVCKAYPALKPIASDGTLQVTHEIVRLPLPPVSPSEIEQARLDVRTARDNTRDGFMRLVRAYRILDVAAREGKPYEVEVQVITLGGDAAWVSWPGEIFVELGLSVKAASPFAHTYNVELANGAIGYIPNKSAWPEGNYEVESARVAEGSGEMLVSSALRQLSALHARALEAGR
jgi:hypothetical protein